MTEERFESMYDGAFIKDKINNRTFCCDDQNDWLDVCDLLNEQNKRIIKLGQENDQLKTHYDSIAESICNWDFDEIVKVMDAQQKTEQENKELKSKLDYVEKVLGNIGYDLVYSEKDKRWVVE